MWVGVIQPLESLDRIKWQKIQLTLPVYVSYENHLLPSRLLVLRPSDPNWNLHHQLFSSQAFKLYTDFPESPAYLEQIMGLPLSPQLYEPNALQSSCSYVCICVYIHTHTHTYIYTHSEK